MAEDPFKSPFAQSPGGGVMEQLLIAMLRQQAEQQTGIPSYYAGNSSVYEAMKGNNYDARQFAMLEAATKQDAMAAISTFSSPFLLAGREPSPELMQALSAGINAVSPQVAMMAMRSGNVREGLSLFSGGRSQVNFGLGIEGLSRRMRDPITQSQGFQSGMMKAVTDNFFEMASQRETFTRADGTTAPIGPRASRGASELEMLETAAAMSFRGQLPTRSLLLDLAADDQLQAAMDRGDVTGDDFADHGNPLNRFNNRLRGQGYSADTSTYEAMESLRAGGLRGSEAVEAFRQQDKIRVRSLEDSRNNLRDLSIRSDQDAVDTLLAGGVKDPGDLLPLGAVRRADEADAIRKRIAAGTATVNDRHSLIALQQSFTDLDAMSLPEFDSRALEFAATAGSKLGRLAPEDAKDLAAALAASNQGDAAALGDTRYGRLSRDEKLEYIAALTSQDALSVGNVVSGHAASEMREIRADRMDAKDPFNLGELKKIQDEIDTPGDPATATVMGDQAARISKSILERTRVISAVKDFLTDEELSRSVSEVNTLAEQLATQLSNSSAHQVSGASMEQSIRYIQTAANRVGYSRDQILAIASMANQSAEQDGFERPVGTALQERYYASANRYRDLNIEALAGQGYDVYGMDNIAEMSAKDNQLEKGVRRSENVGVAATASLLSKRVGVNVDPDSITGRLIKESRDGEYSQDTRTFLALSRNEKLQQIATDTDRPLDEVIRLVNSEFAVGKELNNSPGIVAAGMGSARKTAFDNVAMLMQDGATSLAANRLGLRGRERDEFVQNLTRVAAGVVRDSSPEMVSDITSKGEAAGTVASAQYAEIQERAANGSAADQAFLNEFSTKAEALAELRINYENMAYSYSDKTQGDTLSNVNARAGSTGNRTEATGRARDEAESILVGLLSDREKDPKKRAVNTMMELARSGGGKTLVEMITDFYGVDSSGKIPAELLDAAEYFDQLSGDAGADGNADRAAALEDVAVKLRRGVAADPILDGKSKRLVEDTKRLADSRAAGSAGEMDKQAMADIAAGGSNIMDVPGDTTGASSSAIGERVSEAFARIKEAVVEVINLSGANISLNGKPVITNASGNIVPAGRTPLSSVPGTN